MESYQLAAPPSHYARAAKRFRGLLPVVVDVETAGFNPQTDALLEIAAVVLQIDETGRIQPAELLSCHVQPFQGAKLNPDALAVNKIDPFHPFRFAAAEPDALTQIYQPLRAIIKAANSERAVLVGHNGNFDLSFLIAANQRCRIKNSPFHQFTVFDTATLSGLAFGETVLAKAAKCAGIEFDRNQAHSAIYDAERTAELFCFIVNRWQNLGGWK
ncbi:MAG: ribonuclease T [Coxiellaceae bacterium]|nr:MAG: ribonuclease T [Coxiellaceae bacterium]